MEPPPIPFHRQRRVIFRVVGIVAVLWLMSLGAVFAWGVMDDARRADAIVVMGAAQYAGHPSPALRARLDHAVVLWRRQLAPRMLLTGGIGEGDTASEAAVSRTYVLAHGVPDTSLLLENEGRTSSQSLQGAADLLHARGLHSAVLVSDPFHMLRLEILSRRFGIAPYTSPALPAPVMRRLLRQWASLMAETLKAPLALFLDW